MPDDIDKLTRWVNGMEIKSMQSLIVLIGKLSYPLATLLVKDLTTAVISCSVVGWKNIVFVKLPVSKKVCETGTVGKFLDKLGPILEK